MSLVGKVEEIAKTEFTRTFEWRIGDFFSLSEEDGKCYWSPDFLIDGEYWFLSILPNGDSKDDSVGYIGVCLFRFSPGPSKSMTWTFSIKTVDGKKYCEKQTSYVLSEAFRRGFPKFLKRSELIEKKYTLVPDGVLTILVCKTESCSKSTTYDADNPVKAKCSDCKEEFDAKSLPSHKQKCLNKPIRCPTCNDVVELRNWFDHKCPQLRAQESTKEVPKQDSTASPSTSKNSECLLPHPFENMIRDFKKLFLNQECCDVVIRVKEQEFKAHKAILVARSPVLASAFRNDMKEKATGIIEIKDCDPNCFSEFLHFLYCGSVEKRVNVFGVFTIADKYDVQDLRSLCVEFMKSNLSLDTFCEILTLALQHTEKELIDSAVDFFAKHIQEVIVRVDWQSFIVQNPIAGNEILIKALASSKK